MLAKLRPRLTYGNVMATIAVLIALGGTSYAAVRITGKNVVNNSLTGADIKNDSLTGADIKNLTSGDIANGRLLAEDFAPGQVLTPGQGDGLYLTPGQGDGRYLTPGQGDGRYLTPSQGDGRYLTPSQGDGRYLTPSQGDGRYLTPGQGDGRYLPASGQIRLNASPLTWQKISAAPGVDTLPQRPSIGATSFGGSSGALNDVPVAIEPTLPTVLVGKPLKFVGVNACYATDAVTTLDTVMIHVTTNAAGSGNTSQLLTDTTDRTDTACRDYTLPTPHALASGEDVSLEYDVNYSTNAGFFTAGRATFIFAP